MTYTSIFLGKSTFFLFYLHIWKKSSNFAAQSCALKRKNDVITGKNTVNYLTSKYNERDQFDSENACL